MQEELNFDLLQEDRMSKAKVSDILSEIFKKIGSKENTKEVSGAPSDAFVLFFSTFAVDL